MVSASKFGAQNFGFLTGAVMAALLISGCNKIGGDARQDPQQKLSLTGPATGGRTAQTEPTATSAAVGASAVDFGDDSSKFSKDGECDDKRFTGAGMTDTPLLDSDVKHDATDCRAAFSQGRLKLGGG